MAVTRTVAFGTMLDQAAERFREGLAAGRTPARTNIERSLNIVDSYLATDVADDPFVRLAGPDDWDGEDRWRQDLTSAVAGELRPAFARYRAALADELLPVARPDERCGLQWLDDGAELYQALIELHTGLPLTPEELHQVGLQEVNETLPAQYREVGGRQFGTDDLREIYRHLLDDPDLKYRDGDEILADARAALDAATEAMGDWFGILPEAPCVLTPVPDFLAADSPAAYYTPPAPDGSRPGEYHVNLHDAAAAGSRRDGVDRATTRPSPAITSSSRSRRSGPTSPRSAGCPGATPRSWRAGRSTPSAWPTRWACTAPTSTGSACSRRDSWRACRLVVDTGLHAMGWTRQQAIDFMVAARAGRRRGDRRRGRPLHRHARPGARLQGRPARDPRAARRRPPCARRPLRHQDVPRSRARWCHDQPPGAADPHRRLDGERRVTRPHTAPLEPA